MLGKALLLDHWYFYGITCYNDKQAGFLVNAQKQVSNFAFCINHLNSLCFCPIYNFYLNIGLFIALFVHCICALQLYKTIYYNVYIL